MNNKAKALIGEGSPVNKVERLAQHVAEMSVFKPISVSLLPERFSIYDGMRKDFLRLVNAHESRLGALTFTEQNSLLWRELMKDYAISQEELAGLGTTEMLEPLGPPVIGLLMNVDFELKLTTKHPELMDNPERLKGLKLTIYLNYDETEAGQGADLISVPATIVKAKYGGILISGNMTGYVNATRPVEGEPRVLGCVISWEDTDLDFNSEYAPQLLWEDEGYTLEKIEAHGLGRGIRLSILEVQDPVMDEWAPSEVN